MSQSVPIIRVVPPSERVRLDVASLSVIVRVATIAA